jgi:hypothetical protein
MFWTLSFPFHPLVCIVVDGLYITGLTALSFSWLRASKHPRSAVNLAFGGWVLCLFAFIHRVAIMVTSLSWSLLPLEDRTAALVRCLFQTLGIPGAISIGALAFLGIRWAGTADLSPRQRVLWFVGLAMGMLVLLWMTYIINFLWRSYGYYSNDQCPFP